MPIFGDDGGRRAKEKQAKAEGRLPPGQSLTIKWPVLHYGSVPHFDVAKWDFKISGLVETPLRLTWEEFRALEPAGQSVERRAVHGCRGTREGQTGSRIRASARRGGIYVEYPAEGFVAAGCLVRFRT